VAYLQLTELVAILFVLFFWVIFRERALLLVALLRKETCNLGQLVAYATNSMSCDPHMRCVCVCVCVCVHVCVSVCAGITLQVK